MKTEDFILGIEAAVSVLYLIYSIFRSLSENNRRIKKEKLHLKTDIDNSKKVSANQKEKEVIL